MINGNSPPSSNRQQKLSKIGFIRGRSLFVIAILLAGDILSLILAFAFATQIRRMLIPWIGGVINWDVFFPLLQLNLLSVLISHALIGLYPGFGKTAVEEMRQIFSSVTLGYGLLGLAVYFQKAGPTFPRSVFILGWFCACIFNLIARLIIRNRASLFSWWGIPGVIIGPGDEAKDVIVRLLHSRRMGLRPVLFLDESDSISESHILGVPVIRSWEALQQITPAKRIMFAVLVESHDESRALLTQRLKLASKMFQTVLVVMSDSPLGSLWVRTMDLEGRLALRTSYHLLDKNSIIFKRVFDLVIGSFIVIVSLPLFVFIALLIKVESRGPVFYRQERLGLRGKTIHYLKFRTMRLGAEQELEKLLKESSETRREFEKHHKLKRDPRVTRIGRFLRKFSLDELPQFWHVLQGDLSLVGPRAYMIEEIKDIGDYAPLILQVRPGITGWWQVMGRHATTFQRRLQLDEYYISNWSIWLDIYILLKTVWVAASGVGA